MQPLTILLVEDEPVISLDLQLELEQAGHRVLTASDVASALKLSAQCLPDVAILNFHFRDSMDGMALARLLHARYLVRVFFVTGARWQDMECPEHFYAGQEIIYKPFTRRQLRSIIQSIDSDIL